MAVTCGMEILTDWGKEALRLEAMSKREILDELREKGWETEHLRHQLKYRIIATISRVTANQYDRDGFLIQK